MTDTPKTAHATPAATPMAAPAARLEEAEWWRGRSDGIHPRVCTCEMCQRLNLLRAAAAQPQRESEQPEQALRETLTVMVEALRWYANKYGLGPAKLQYALSKGEAALSPQTDSQEPR